MYNQQEIALKIKESARKKNITIKTLLDECNLNINYVSDLSKGNDTMISSIYKIAEYLDISIDYLLGRTEQKTGQIIHNENQSGGVQSNTYNNGSSELNGLQKEMIEAMNKLPKVKQLRALEEVYKIIEEE